MKRAGQDELLTRRRYQIDLAEAMRLRRGSVERGAKPRSLRSAEYGVTPSHVQAIPNSEKTMTEAEGLKAR